MCCRKSPCWIFISFLCNQNKPAVAERSFLKSSLRGLYWCFPPVVCGDLVCCVAFWYKKKRSNSPFSSKQTTSWFSHQQVFGTTLTVNTFYQLNKKKWEHDNCRDLTQNCQVKKSQRTMMVLCHLSFWADGCESARNLSARSFLLIKSPINPHRYAGLVFSLFFFLFFGCWTVKSFGVWIAELYNQCLCWFRNRCRWSPKSSSFMFRLFLLTKAVG